MNLLFLKYIVKNSLTLYLVAAFLYDHIYWSVCKLGPKIGIGLASAIRPFYVEIIETICHFGTRSVKNAPITHFVSITHCLVYIIHYQSAKIEEQNVKIKNANCRYEKKN